MQRGLGMCFIFRTVIFFLLQRQFSQTPFLLLKLTKFNDVLKILLWGHNLFCSFHRKWLLWPWTLALCNAEVLDTWTDVCEVTPCPAVHIYECRTVCGAWGLQGQEGDRSCRFPLHLRLSLRDVRVKSQAASLCFLLHWYLNCIDICCKIWGGPVSHPAMNVFSV